MNDFICHHGDSYSLLFQLQNTSALSLQHPYCAILSAFIMCIPSVLSSSPRRYLCCRNYSMDLLLCSSPWWFTIFHHSLLLSFLYYAAALHAYWCCVGTIVAPLAWMTERFEQYWQQIEYLALFSSYCNFRHCFPFVGMIMHVSVDVYEGGRASSSVHPFFIASWIIVIFHFFHLSLHQLRW